MKQFLLKHRVAVVVWTVVVTAVIVLVTMTGERKFTDTDLAYCLTNHDEQRVQLVDAAVALGFAEQGSTPAWMKIKDQDQHLTLEEWRKAHQTEFQKSCLALNPPQQLSFWEQIVSAESGLVGVMAALIGGGAYYLSERARDRTQRRDEDARRLNVLGAAFVATVENYVRQRRAASPPYDVDQIGTRRNELVSELQLVQARHDGWTAPNDPLELLRGILSDELTGEWHDKNQRAAELRTALDTLAKQISSIAVKLERGRPRESGTNR
jgi:hypothetical protein